MKSLPQWSATFLLTAPVGAWALGLGDIELQSALNQPLRAEIELLSVTPEDLDGLRVSLASRETFARYELDLSSDLSALEFDVARNAAGRYVVTVTSREPIANPFLTFLVEATWPRGRLLREYTVLLDPPIFTPELGAEPPIRQAEAGAPSDASGAFARTPQTSAAPPAAATAQAASSTPPSSAPPGPQAAFASGSYGPVQSAETLWSIASRLRPADVSVNQMMVALYEANPAAFDDNMNVLLRGATLTIPDRSALTARSVSEATAIVRREEDAWGGGESADGESAGEQLAATEAAPTSAEEPRLRLVPPSVESVAAASAGRSASGAGAGSGSDADGAGTAEVARLESEVLALRSELEESRRLLQLRDQELEALQARLAAADALPAATEPPAAAASTPGVDLEARVDESPFADDLGVETEADVASEPTPETEPAVTTPAAASAAPPVVGNAPAPEPSLLSRVLGALQSPLLLIGLGIGAVLLTAVWYLRNRREDADEVTGRWDALAADEDTIVDEPAVEPTRKLRAVDENVVIDEHSLTSAMAAAESRSDAAEIEDTLSSHTVLDLDQGDVLAEADFHMAYGLYDQAAELVQSALANEPERRDLKLKLLEVFFVWGNKDAFRDAARELKGDGSDGDWDKVLIMGKQLCPDDPLFAEATSGGAGEIDLDLEGTGGATSIDFAFDERAQHANAPDADDTSNAFSATGLDFELAATGERLGTSFDDDSSDSGDDVLGADDDLEEEGLDIGAATAAGLEAALLSDDDEETGRVVAELDSDDDTARASAELVEDDDMGAGEPDFGLGDTDDSTDIELEGLASTQESPTVESETQGGGNWRAALGFDDADDNTDLDLEALIDDDAQSPTMETPTMETPTVEAAGPDAPTVELAADSNAPTMESPWLGSATSETPTIEAEGPDVPTVETPTVESPQSNTALLRAIGETSEMPTLDASATGEFTQEIDLDDLGLSVEDLSGLPDDIGTLPGDDAGDTREQAALTSDDDLLSATGVTEIVDASLGDDDELETIGTAVLDDRDATMLASDEMLEGRTQVIEGRAEMLDGTHDGRGSGRMFTQSLDGGAAGADAADSGLDLDLDDLATALSGGDTVEQPRASFESEIFGEDDSTPVDLDVGMEDAADQDAAGSLDPHTMTEIGTKLDLARAYIDMGDPDGARSILEEVLDEGDAGQRREAQGLIDAIAS